MAPERQKRKPEFPVVSQQSHRNSKKTMWFPLHHKMRPLPATASQEKSHGLVLGGAPLTPLLSPEVVGRFLESTETHVH